MTDWATYPLQVIKRGNVLNDEEIKLMCSHIQELRAEIGELADEASKYQSALFLIGKRGMTQAVIEANERAEGWRRRWCELNLKMESGSENG